MLFFDTRVFTIIIICIVLLWSKIRCFTRYSQSCRVLKKEELYTLCENTIAVDSIVCIDFKRTLNNVGHKVNSLLTDTSLNRTPGVGPVPAVF